MRTVEVLGTTLRQMVAGSFVDLDISKAQHWDISRFGIPISD